MCVVAIVFPRKRFLTQADPVQLAQMLSLIDRLCKGDVVAINDGDDEKMNCEPSTSTARLPVSMHVFHVWNLLPLIHQFARAAKPEELASEVHVLHVVSEERLSEASNLKGLRLLNINGIDRLSARRLQKCTERLSKLETLTVIDSVKLLFT